jgi:hypothetical protein
MILKFKEKNQKYRMRITFLANSGGTVYNDWYKDNPGKEIDKIQDSKLL